jgi:hypothetical protein
MLRYLLAAAIVSAVTFQALPALAGGCGDTQPPSPATNIPTGIRFTNGTQYAMRIYWADFDGQLKEYALVQPEETVGFDTYVHHRWYAELYTPIDTACAGPISAPDTETCDMRFVFNEDTGEILMDGGYCDN